MGTATKHPLAERAALTRELPSVKATPENCIKYGKMVLDLIGQLPPDMTVRNFSSLGLSLGEEEFARLFAGCEVNESMDSGRIIGSRWVYIDHIEISCTWIPPREEKKPQRWTRTLPAPKEEPADG